MKKLFSISGVFNYQKKKIRETWNWYFIDDEGTLVAALLEGLRWIAADQVRNVAVGLKYANTRSYILPFPCIKRNNINFYFVKISNMLKKYLPMLIVDDWWPSYDNWTPWPPNVHADMWSNSNLSMQRYRKMKHIFC